MIELSKDSFGTCVKFDGREFRTGDRVRVYDDEKFKERGEICTISRITLIKKNNGIVKVLFLATFSGASGDFKEEFNVYEEDTNGTYKNYTFYNYLENLGRERNCGFKAFMERLKK